MARKSLSIDDLSRVVSLVSVRLSPSGAKAVLHLTRPNPKKQRTDSWFELWRASDGRIVRLTHGPFDSGAQWLDEDTIVFTSRDREEDSHAGDKPFGKTRLYTIAADGGEAELRAELDGAVFDFAPSPDGRRIALSFAPNPAFDPKQAGAWERAPRPQFIRHPFYKLDGVGALPESLPAIHLLRVRDGEWGKPKPLVDEPTMWDGTISWMPDSRAMVFVRYDPYKMTTNDSRLMRVDLKGVVAALGAPVGPIAAHEVSPDGRLVAYCGNGDPKAGGCRPYALRTCSTEPGDAKSDRVVFASDGKAGTNDVLSDMISSGGPGIRWESPDSILIQHAVHGHTELLRVSLADGSSEVLAGATGVMNAFDVAGGRILFGHADPCQPGELFTHGDVRPLSKWNAAVAPLLDVRPSRWFVETDPGVRVDTYLWATKRQLGTAKARSLPLVVYVHGGPAAQAGDAPFHEYAWLAENGYPVVIGNPRGSTGYGDDHGMGIWGNWGDRDVFDILAMTDACLARHPQFDPDRVFLVGGSYGGYMAMMMATRHPGRFRALIAQRSVSNFVSMAGTSDIGPRLLPQASGISSIFENPERVWELSPISKADAVIDPMLITHSDGDLRCPIGQGEEFFTALTTLGHRMDEEVRFVIFRGENHNLSRGGKPENRRVRLEEILGWLKKHDHPRAKAKAKAVKARRRSK